MAQNWAGTNWGGLVTPRIGMEVVITYIDGDPDRPLVIGCVYNADHIPPDYVTESPTKSTFKTNTSKKGGGFNELRFEDKKGDEEIYMHAQKDWNNEIIHSRTEDIFKGDDTLTVHKGDKTVIQEGHGTTHLLQIKDGDDVIEVTKGDFQMTLKKGNSVTELKKGNCQLTLTEGNNVIELKKGNYQLTLGKGDVTIKVTGKVNITSTDDISLESKKNINLTAGMNISMKAKMNIERKADLAIKDEGNMVTVEGKATTEIKGGAMVKVQGPAVKIN